MKKNLQKTMTVLFCSILIFSCSSTTPETYFNTAVLNTNMFAGFGSNGILRQMGSGEADKTYNKKQMDVKIKFIEENFEKVKDLKQTDDTKEMINASLALYEYILPVYKTEYVKLAELFDSGAAEAEIQSFNKSIQDKYYNGFKELYDNLIRIGKMYAEKHNIKVNWGTQ